MKGKLIAFASVLCIASLMASGANADKPEDKGKPDKTNTELIVFTGGLQGWAHVEGCCPNAGPFPWYTMYLPDGLRDFDNEQIYPSGTYYGTLFINIDGVGHNSGNNNIVQFHACCIANDSGDECDGLYPELKFQIRGGEGAEAGRKKDRVSTVTFTNARYWADSEDWIRDEDEYAGEVSFTMTRAPSSCTDLFCDCEYAEVAPHLCLLP